MVRWLEKKAEMTASRFDDIVLASLGIPLVVGVIVISIYAALQVANLPAGLEWIVESKYYDAIYVIIGAWVVSGFVKSFITIYGSRLLDQSEIDERMIHIALIASKYLIWFITFLIILSILEIDITAFLAGAGIIGIAVGLAAKDFIANFFGGAIIVMDKPFELYDRIKIDQYIGDVVHVGSRSTRLKTPDNQIVTIPNSTITNSFVVNYTKPNAVTQIRIPIGVAYGTDVQQVKQILMEIALDLAERIPYILSEPEPAVYFLEFGVSGLKFELDLWTSDVTKASEVKDAVNVTIADKFARERIEIPYPRMDVRIRGAYDEFHS
jgi:small-conductance mechanosensitive channel